MKFLPYGKQWIDKEDVKAVIDVLRGDWLTQGPAVEQFEKALARYCGAKYAVAVSSGTSALHIACLAAGIERDDEVITSPITFVASANCVLYCGGRPVFVDIDRESHNIDPGEVKKRITARTKAIIPVHFSGLPCEMDLVSQTARAHNLTIIEDACHALGARYKVNGKWIKVGSCRHSDMTVFSFHPVKHITTGEGGAILTNKPGLYEKLLLFRNHGITKNSRKFTNKDMGFSSDSTVNPWYYEMQELGYNYRITDIQCALGISQLKKLDIFISRRREIASMYDRAFSDSAFIHISLQPASKKSACHLYLVQIDFEKLAKSRSAVMNKLNKQGIGTQVHYIPVHLQPYYRTKFGFKPGDYPEAEVYYDKALSLPLYPGMTDADAKRVVNSLKECVNVK